MTHRGTTMSRTIRRNTCMRAVWEWDDEAMVAGAIQDKNVYAGMQMDSLGRPQFDELPKPSRCVNCHHPQTPLPLTLAEQHPNARSPSGDASAAVLTVHDG